eukprot:gb/GECG01004766.1/.p1 GENE.gb/GECG01004766.1/~~gb/GECG01004766.1/.p1  ORF type:complete len:134 (+),score=20.62 gb/GECG01004766.1/:1-402(+)
MAAVEDDVNHGLQDQNIEREDQYILSKEDEQEGDDEFPVENPASAPVTEGHETWQRTEGENNEDPDHFDPKEQFSEPDQPYIQKGCPALDLSWSENPDKKGYLMKYAGVNFQYRYFVLRGGVLLYYLSQQHPG